MKPSDFIGEKAIYDEGGQMIFGVQKNEHNQLIADVRGWGAIQNLFKNPNGTIDEAAAMKYQDDLGKWIVDAINEKLERERNLNKSVFV